MTAAATRPRECSVARTLEIVGEKWALLAIREVFLGNHRFDEMVRRTGAPRDTLAARLRSLTGAGILERRQYSVHPARHEYRLTEAGRELYPVILTLMRWGDEHRRRRRRAAHGARARVRPPPGSHGRMRSLRPAGRGGARRGRPPRPGPAEPQAAWVMLRAMQRRECAVMPRKVPMAQGQGTPADLAS